MNEEAKTIGVKDHPLLLTTLVLYSIVLGLPLAKFPPIDSPTHSDLFVSGAVLIILVRMALTFYYAALVDKYPGRLFVLEVATAGILAWQFRVLLDARIDGPGSRLWLFYVLHLLLVGTMFLWSRILLTGSGLRPAPRALVLRTIGIAASLVGLVFEFPEVTTKVRMIGRWAIGGVLLILAIVYALGRPWLQFEKAARAPDSGS